MTATLANDRGEDNMLSLVRKRDMKRLNKAGVMTMCAPPLHCEELYSQVKREIGELAGKV